MKVKSLISIFLVGVVLVLAGCFKFEEPVLIENLSGDEIVFGADAQIEAQTKASSGTTETTSLTSFYVSAVTGSAGSESSAWTSTQFSQVAGSSPATYKGSKMWPASNPSYKFYVSNRPLTFAAAGTTVSATNTTDVVCAYLTNGTYKTKNTLTFEHIFARFGRVDVVAESGYTISNISIRITPKTGGTYNLRTGAGKTDGTGWSSVTTGSATVVANATGANANDIYLVPGTYEVKATWTATQGGTSITYTDKVVNVPIVGGKTNVVSIVLGGEILFGVDLEEYCEYNYRDNLDYLTFYCDEAGTIGWKCNDASVAKTIQYSKDQGATWTSITSTTSGVTVSVSAGDILWFKGSNSSYGGILVYNFFTLTKKAHVYGNVNSLTGNSTSVGQFCFYRLFFGCGSHLYTYAEKKIILPATTLASNCYSYMFEGCTSLTTVPELPARTLAASCYSGMFKGCTSLTTAPELPVTTLTGYCYSSMFEGCTSLTIAPELPAMTLAYNCYSGMFNGCTSLTTAPELPATTMASMCYQSMFYGCTSLTTAPELPATTLAEYCYSSMFYGCTSLNYIKALFTTTPSASYTKNWVSGVAATGTFVKNVNATWDVSGSNGVPTGWTVKTEAAPIGRFTVNANGDQVGFAPGNLQCTVQSALAVDSYVYIGTDWRFTGHQWDYYLSPFEVGNYISHFCWVGKSATYDSFGLCSSSEANAPAYFGSVDNEPLKTDWGNIPGIVSTCGSGWFTLSSAEWTYILSSRITGVTLNGVSNARFTGAIINNDSTPVNGILIFPDGFNGGGVSGISWGTINPSIYPDSSSPFAYNTVVNTDAFKTLENSYGVVFIPAAGWRAGNSYGASSEWGFVWCESSSSSTHGKKISFSVWAVKTEDEDMRRGGLIVRLAKKI